jgi:hypothetical protein
MMAMGAVDVAVFEFFRGRRPHVEDLAFEAQALAGPRMIAVEDRLAVGDISDGEHNAAAVLIAAAGFPFQPRLAG